MESNLEAVTRRVGVVGLEVVRTARDLLFVEQALPARIERIDQRA